MPISSLLEQIDTVMRLALDARFGLKVRVNEFGPGAFAPASRIQKIIYHYRAELGDATLDDLTIDLHPSDPDHLLWIYKTSEVWPGQSSVHRKKPSTEIEL